MFPALAAGVAVRGAEGGWGVPRLTLSADLAYNGWAQEEPPQVLFIPGESPMLSPPSRSVRPAGLLVAAFALSALGFGSCPGNPLLQTREQVPGFVEPHTPGSGLAEEFLPPAGGTIEQILGTGVDLNHVDYIRTAFTDGHPKVILIAIPGFLGGGSTFDPLARDLVGSFKGSVEVWAVDRRSNQLEDRRGALHARAQAEAAGGDSAAVFQALSEGVRFYFPGSDTDEDSIPDPAFELPDAFGTPSSFLRLSQDEVRPFGAHWGVDTYARDWRELVLHARSIVGESGLVLFGGHSMGTTWTGVFAAYDFDPGPGVEAGYELVDGLVLFEGGGPNEPSASAPDLADYQAAIAGLEAPGGDPIFLEDLFGFIDAVELGGAGELNGLAGTFAPDESSIVQTTPIFGGFPISLLLPTATNRSLVGYFLDDDFSTNAAFSASMGFSADHLNYVNPFVGFFDGEFYVGLTQPGVPRTWINYDSPRFDEADPDPLTCPPLLPPPFPDADLGDEGTGCAIIDNGPEPGPGDPPAQWGVEREVTDIGVLLRTLYETGNASEWYFNSGRPNVDLAFGRDSSALGAPELLNVTQNANVDVPVLAIGGSNGLTPTESSFDDYLGSIASTDTEVVILEGYSHLDVLSAAENEALPPLAAWILKLRIQKIFESLLP